MNDYERGYEDGESSQLIDWLNAFDDIIPDDAAITGPSAAAAWVRKALDAKVWLVMARWSEGTDSRECLHSIHATEEAARVALTGDQASAYCPSDADILDVEEWEVLTPGADCG